MVAFRNSLWLDPEVSRPKNGLECLQKEKASHFIRLKQARTALEPRNYPLEQDIESLASSRLSKAQAGQLAQLPIGVSGGQAKGGRIIHPGQIQAAGFECGCGQAPVALLQQLRRPGWRLTALAYIDQRPHQVAYHVMQESVGAEAEQEIIALLLDVRARQRAHRVGRLAFRGTEGAEIMFTQQMPGRLLHAGQLERPEHPGRPALRQGRTHPMLAYQ